MQLEISQVYDILALILFSMFVLQAVFEGILQADYINRKIAPKHSLYANLRIPSMITYSILAYYYIEYYKGSPEEVRTYLLYVALIPSFLGLVYMTVFDEVLNAIRIPKKPLGYLGGADEAEDSFTERYMNFFKKNPWMHFILKLILILIVLVILVVL